MLCESAFGIAPKNSTNIAKYRVIINDCPIAVAVENPHKFWMCRQPRNTGQTIVYFFLVGGSGRHLQNPATKCDLPIGY
jgi:hypothetical protein